MPKEGGEEGQKEDPAITRYTTVGLALLLMGFAYYVMLKNYNLLNETGFLAGLVIVLTFTAGAAFLMWVGEQINQFGIGNGISMILFAGIVSRIPSLVSGVKNCCLADMPPARSTVVTPRSCWFSACC